MQGFGKRFGQGAFTAGGEAVNGNDDTFHKRTAKVANQATFTARMMALFSEDFFCHALIWLFGAVTLVLMAFSVLVLCFLPGQKPGAASVAPTRNIPGNTPGDAVQVNNPEYPGVSIILCARNEAANLQQHLSGLLRQEYPGPWELVVVDDASEDDTGAVLQELQEQHPRLRVVTITEKQHPGKKQALAQGITSARFDVLLLTDADCRPAGPQWAEKMTAPLLKSPAVEFVLGYGPTATGRGFLGGWIRFETAFVATQYLTCARAGMPYMGVGRNLAFRKRVFERMGGFSQHVHLASGDDDLLVNAAATGHNTTWCADPQAFVYSEGKTTWEGWARQKRRHLSAGVAYRWSHQMVLGMLGMSYTLHYFLLFCFLLMGTVSKTVLFLWLSRTILLYLMYRRSFSVLREPGLLSQFPIYDALLAVYYGAFVPTVLIGKKTHSWN